MDAQRSSCVPAVALLAALVAELATGPALCAASSESSAEATAALARANNRFGVELLAQLGPDRGNLAFSPFGIATTLALISTGARGATAEELTRALHLDEVVDPQVAFAALSEALAKTQQKGQVALDSANSLWLQRGYGFAPAFLDVARSRYGAAAQEVDFSAAAEAARGAINAWAERATRGKLAALIPAGALPSGARLVLANTVYLKGNWAQAFDPARTELAEFHLTGGGTARLPLMHRRSSLRYLKAATFQAVELPHRDADLAFVVLLPDAIDGVARLAAALTEERVTKVLADLEASDVDLFLPRFKVESGLELAGALARGGMPLLFGPGADLSGISEHERLTLAAFLHQARVEVDEQGAEAAAASAVVAMAMLRRAVTFRADHPFLFLIRYAPSGHILFLGQVTDPTTPSASGG